MSPTLCRILLSWSAYTGGTYLDEKNATSAAMCKMCPAGQYCAPGSIAGVDCPAGFFCTSGQTTGFQNSCPIGTYSSAIGLTSKWTS